MSMVSLKLMACAARRTFEGWLSCGVGRVRKTTPRHRCQPSGIRYALRVSRLPPPPVDSRTKFLQISCFKFVRLHEGDDTWTIRAEQQKRSFPAVLSFGKMSERKDSAVLDESPQGWSSQPHGRR
jgi:hypothetical protein